MVSIEQSTHCYAQLTKEKFITSCLTTSLTEQLAVSVLVTEFDPVKCIARVDLDGGQEFGLQVSAFQDQLFWLGSLQFRMPQFLAFEAHTRVERLAESQHAVVGIHGQSLIPFRCLSYEGKIDSILLGEKVIQIVDPLFSRTAVEDFQGQLGLLLVFWKATA